MENAVEEFAIDNLLDTLIQKSEPLSTTRAVKAKTHTSATDTPTQSSGTSDPVRTNQLTLRLHNIADLLSDNASPQVGEWPVVVSQEGIRQFQQYLRDDRGMFDRIEKTIRLDSEFPSLCIPNTELILTLSSQLSKGFFSLSNYYEIVSQIYGIPMYSANLGGGLRLVYQIDFGAPVDAWTESQCGFFVFGGMRWRMLIPQWLQLSASSACSPTRRRTPNSGELLAPYKRSGDGIILRGISYTKNAALHSMLIYALVVSTRRRVES